MHRSKNTQRMYLGNFFLCHSFILPFLDYLHYRDRGFIWKIFYFN